MKSDSLRGIFGIETSIYTYVQLCNGMMLPAVCSLQVFFYSFMVNYVLGKVRLVMKKPRPQSDGSRTSAFSSRFSLVLPAPPVLKFFSSKLFCWIRQSESASTFQTFVFLVARLGLLPVLLLRGDAGVLGTQ